MFSCRRCRASTGLAGELVHGLAASAGSDKGGDADRDAIEKLHQKDIAATSSRVPVALTDLWTDDAVRLGRGRPAEVGKQAIREHNERWSASRCEGVEMLPEVQDLTILDGWESSGVTSLVRLLSRRVASRNRFVARCSACTRSDRTELEMLPREGNHRTSSQRHPAR